MQAGNQKQRVSLQLSNPVDVAGNDSDARFPRKCPQNPQLPWTGANSKAEFAGLLFLEW
jgi:hypothetical protein